MSIEIVDGSYSPVPSNKTFSKLKCEVARFVLQFDDDEALAIAGDGITEAIRQLNYKPWLWSLDQADITLVAGTVEYAGPDDFHKPRHASFLDSSGNKKDKIYYLDPKSFDDRDAAGPLGFDSLGGFRYYTITNIRDDGLIRFNGTFDAGFVAENPTIRLLYYKYINYPTSDSEVISVPAHVESYILWSAKSYIASQYNMEKVAYAEGKAQLAWKQLTRDEHRRGDF